MASVEQTAIRREAALNRLAAAVTALIDQRGVNVGEFPMSGKDPMALQAEQIEWTASALETFADASTASPGDDDTTSDADPTNARAAVVETVKRKAAKGS